MFPSETAGESEETAYGYRLVYLTILWILATVAAGLLLILLAPWMQGLF